MLRLEIELLGIELLGIDHMNDVQHRDEDESSAPELLGQKSWTRGTQRIASVLWPSFVAAAVGMLVCFSFIDPEMLGVALMPEREISVLTGYGLCFFFLWSIALLSSATTMYLRKTRNQEQNNSNND
jgi:hypothetical protein